MMHFDLRTRLMLATAVPPIAIAVAALAGVPAAGVTVLGIAAAGLSAAAVSAVLANFGRLRSATADLGGRLDALAGGAEPVGGFPVEAADDTGGMARVLAAAEARLAETGRLLRERDQQLRDALARTAQALTAAATATGPLKMTLPGLPCPREAEAVAGAFAKLSAGLAAAAGKARGYLSVLQDLPDPVLVFDAKNLHLQFLNAAGIRFYPHLASRKKALTTADLFCMPSPDRSVHDGSPLLTPQAVREWLLRGQGGLREAVSTGPQGHESPVEVAAVPQFERKSPEFVTALVRDLSAGREAEAAARRRQRQLIAQRLCRLLAREAKPALDAVRTQANLLSQVGKQAGIREKVLPKTQRIVEEVGRQELVVDLLDWLGSLSTGRAGDPDAREVRLGDVAREVGERLGPAFAERGNELVIEQDAGWVLVDESWLVALLTGVLAHANLAGEKGTVRVRLRRRSAVHAHEEHAEVTVEFAGPSLPSVVLADVRDPYRRPESAVFDPDRPGGFLLGLAVACKLSQLMLGEFVVEEAEGRPAVRVLFPTRAGGVRAAAVARAVTPAVADPNDGLAETVGGWGVGGESREAADGFVGTAAETGAVPATVAFQAGGPADAPPDDDTVGNWFGPAPD